MIQILWLATGVSLTMLIGWLDLRFSDWLEDEEGKPWM